MASASRKGAHRGRWRKRYDVVLMYCTSRNEIYIAPSGVQKERIEPEDMFVISAETYEVIRSPPPEKALRPSQCTPLFFNAYRCA